MEINYLEVEKLVKLGLKREEISSILDIPVVTLSRFIRENSIFPMNIDFFNIIDCEIKAYLLGFYIADGSIYQNKAGNYIFEFSLKKEDGYMVNIMRDYLHPSKAVYEKKNCITLSIGSKELCTNILKTYNSKLNKTYDKFYEFPFDKIPKELFNHFLRGFMDGDGSIKNSKTFIKKENKILYYFSGIRFTSSHINFLNYIAKYFEKMGFTHRLHSRDEFTNNLQINSNKKNSKKLYDFFYHNANFYLKRKRKSIEDGMDNTEVIDKISKGLSTP